MTDTARDFCLQYMLRRREIKEIHRRLRDALAEDRRENADMFDIHRLSFSAARHPNATMRALEADLQAADTVLLSLLSVLTELGMETLQGLADFSAPEDFAHAAGELLARQMQRDLPAHVTAHALTEIKAEHAERRLSAAIDIMDQCSR